ncbi:nesprin-3 isoform X2 [Melanotaenia boesemani]|uniref:nesprin-3 isoform X2 n=1 Tax=Melanotaenia boesemani TaxID=1250792 RepID=UPI001C03F22D|nr:nesprin-3 isoform X2 [Melanotaenia boesemani]
MTQQEEQEFTESLEAALSWMQAVRERLRANDNTQGPRDALEARLRETEKIHHSEDEGRMMMDLALVAAENLLQSGDEELRNTTHAHLKDLKSQWEETCTYIIHCHSRIEWVWLHWSEYLKAYEEFEMWLTKQRCSLDVGVELQLGLKEKLWQLDQQRVVVSNIHGQRELLNRLLEEAAALHSRTQDPSVDPQVQQRLQDDYTDVKDQAEERLTLLQRISDEHQMFQSCAHRFQTWLVSKTKELTELMERDETADDKLKALQVLDDSVACEEKTLQHIEGVADAVRANTSPAGAESVQEEAEELRLGWQRLRQGLCEAEDGLRCKLDSHSQYVSRCRRLGDGINHLKELLQGLDQELGGTLESRSCLDQNEEQMVGQWRKYTGVRNTLVGEETQVEHLRAQLKELFKFSGDSSQLSNDVLALIKDHQSVKCRVNRLCSESEQGLRTVLQDPLMVYNQWIQMVSQVLEASSDVSNFSHIAMLVQKIESLLKDSVQLQQRLSQLQVKGDLLDSVFGPERAEGLQEDLTNAIRNRELLHTQLVQRKNRLQGFISRTKDFSEAHELIRSKLEAFRDRLLAADVLQPDILAKKSQLDQFLVLQKDLEDYEADLSVLETLVSGSPSNRTQYEKLCGDWKELQRRVKVKVEQSEENISDHQNFLSGLLSIQNWMMIMKQKLDSFCSPSGGWSLEGRHHEAERALAEFPEKEVQLQQVEVQGQGVLHRTSEDGQVHILGDLQHLRQLWTGLFSTSLHLHRLLDGSTATPGQTREQLEPVTQTQPVPSEVGSRGDEGDSSALSRRSESAGRVGIMLAGDGQEAAGSDWPSCTGGGRGEDRVDTAGSTARFRKGASADQSCTGTSVLDRSRWHQFEAWLSRENELLTEILSSKEAGLSAAEVQTRQETLQALRSRVSWGQEQFQLLLQEQKRGQTGPDPAEDVALEELRYRWMLYKSKLKDVGDIRATTRSRARGRGSAKRVAANQEEPPTKAKLQKRCGLLQRACRLAFLLWLLLLALLLFAFLLPFMDEGSSCSLSNNFARSFSIMLRYDGPPPT